MTEPVELSVNIMKVEGSDVIASNAFALEDDFRPFYNRGLDDPIPPPYPFLTLSKLAAENNALKPCIAAMVTNIAGTGYEFVRKDGQPVKKGDAEHKVLEDFFDQPFPGVSFTTLRKEVRNDIEELGNGYLEALRGLDGGLAFVRRVEAKLVRLMPLDAPAVVEKKVVRGGKEVSFKVLMRERRFVMKLTGYNELIYFKEFGASRELDKVTGVWAKAGEAVPPDRRATELIHFRGDSDIRTPYGVPRWVCQTPSVVGSRLAEEHNLSFFDSGGIPPLMVLVQGGQFAEASRQAIEKGLNGKTKNKHRALVLEAFSTSGKLDSAGNVRVTVERFGDARQNDSMFEQYDTRCEQRVRRAFRLPPLFVGAAQDYSYASAFASYTVAEAQVFGPERVEDDEVLNNTVVSALGATEHRFRSKPLSVRDATQQLEGLNIAVSANTLDGEEVVRAVNEVTNLALSFSKETYDKASAAAEGSSVSQGAKTKVDGGVDPGDQVGTRMKKGDSVMIPAGLVELARAMTSAVRKRDLASVDTLMLSVVKLDPVEYDMFKRLLATHHFVDVSLDPEGLGEIAGCALSVMASNVGA